MTAFSGLMTQGEAWIIDSEASDHMTGCEKCFSSYVPSPGNRKVQIVDGAFTNVVRIGDIRITLAITLQGVLHVPNLSCNLLSISKLTKDLNHLYVFFRTAFLGGGLAMLRMYRVFTTLKRILP